MMWDEKQLREALREEIDRQPAPAVKTELSDIMPRGLRRRRFRQAGSAAAAVAVVAGVGVVAMTFGGKSVVVNEPAVPTTVITTTINPQADWAQADLAPKKPYSTWSPGNTAPPPSGYPKLTIPLCDGRDFNPNRPAFALHPDQQRIVLNALRAVAPSARIGELINRDSSYEVDVTDGAGTGSVSFQFGGAYQDKSPVAAADRLAFAEGNCAPPKRKVLADGTVLQIHSVRPSEPFQSLTQRVVVYRPDKVHYTFAVHNWGSTDLKAVANKPKSVLERVGTGRPTLPLTEGQLAGFVDEVVPRLGI